MPTWTPTQQALMNVFSDGNRHTYQELFRCIPDDMCNEQNVKVHISALRKKLRPVGQDILFELVDRQPSYRQTRIVDDGE